MIGADMGIGADGMGDALLGTAAGAAVSDAATTGVGTAATVDVSIGAGCTAGGRGCCPCSLPLELFVSISE